VEVWHEARLAGNDLFKERINLDRIERRQTQAGQGRDLGEDRCDQITKTAPGISITGEINSCQHHFLLAAINRLRTGGNNVCGARRAAISPSIWDDAKGAAVIAAGLHTDESSGVPRAGGERGVGIYVFLRYRVPAKAGGQVCLGWMAASVARPASPCAGIRLFITLRRQFIRVRNDARNFGHRCKLRARHIRPTSGDDDPRIRLGACRAANGLARLAISFSGDGARIDHDELRMVAERDPSSGGANGLARLAISFSGDGARIDHDELRMVAERDPSSGGANGLALGNIEPTPKVQNLNAHSSRRASPEIVPRGLAGEDMGGRAAHLNWFTLAPINFEIATRE